MKLKRTTIGEIPEEWELRNLDEIATLFQYGISRLGKKVGAVPILRMNSLEDGRIKTDDLQYLDSDEVDLASYLLERGDILFNRTNSYDWVGQTALFDIGDPYVFASYMLRLRCRPGLADPRFVNAYLNSPSSQARLKRIATRGVSQSNINASSLRSFQVVVPPLHEQTRIADMLETADNLVQVNLSRRLSLERVKTGLMQDLLIGRVRFPEFVNGAST